MGAIGDGEERTLLEVKNVKAYYRTVGGVHVRAVDGVSLSLKAREVLGIAGESGCGKSTLALVLSFMVAPPLHLAEGEVRIDSQDVTSMDRETLRKEVRGRYVSVVPQGALNALNPTLRIGSLFADVLREHFPSMPTRKAMARAEERLRSLSLSPTVLSLYPHQLSGGMKQRAVIAASTLLNPHVLIADEPTSALDVSSQKAVVKLLVELFREGVIKSIVFITHELPLLRHVADRIAIMYAGKIVEVGTMEQVVFDPLHPYTKALMGSVLVPEHGVKGKKLEAISGAPPDLKRPPSGCRFHPRCARKMDVCENSEPTLTEVGGRQVWCWLAAG